MTILLNSPAEEEYQYLAIPPETLTLSASPAGTLPPIPERGTTYYRQHGNSEQNGRVDGLLPPGEWSQAWKVDLRPGFIPEAVLYGGGRLLVQTGVWQLFSLEGERVREGSSGPGGVSIDADKGRFYHMTKQGDLAGRNLDDGEQAFALMPFLGEEFSRPLIRRVGDRLLLVGLERQLDPHGHKKASRTLLEWVTLGDLSAVTASGMLAGAGNAGTLILPTARALVAASDTCAVAAAPGKLYITRPDATVAHAFEGDIQPVALSLGGNGVIYLALREGEDLALWCLSESGEMLRRYAFPESLQSLVAPPLVGFDGRIYLVGHGTIVALSPDMTSVWTFNEHTPFVGASVTGDGSLLVSSARALGFIDSTGAYHKIAGKAETDYSTAPIVTDSGEVAVASSRQLHVYRTAVE